MFVCVFFLSNYPYLQFQICLQVDFGELHKLENHSLTVTLLTNPAFLIFLFNNLPFPYSLHFILMCFFFQILLCLTPLSFLLPFIILSPSSLLQPCLLLTLKLPKYPNTH